MYNGYVGLLQISLHSFKHVFFVTLSECSYAAVLMYNLTVH